MTETSDYQEIFRVVINMENQYFIWSMRKEIPYGWSEEGKSGTKSKSVSHILKKYGLI